MSYIMKKLGLSLLAIIAVLIMFTSQVGKVSAGFLDQDPFVQYGKHLPWEGSRILYLTCTPSCHKQNYGYYSVNFANNGGDAATIGIPVHAISDGYIAYITPAGDNYDNGWGRNVVINHGNGYYTRYAHMEFTLDPSFVGRAIRSGQEIGLIGDTGHTENGANIELVMYHGDYNNNGNAVRATSDGIPFQGAYSWSQVQLTWITPIDNFDKYRGSAFLSETSPRPAVNPWDPALIDPLDSYLRTYGYLFPAGMVAEPVNTFTGSFLSRNVDLDMQSKAGPALKFERFYNSPDQMISPTGKGWNNNYNIRILAHEGNKFSVKLADGSGETFQGNGNVGEYTSSFTNMTPEGLGTLTRLDQNNGYKFVYTAPDKTVYVFNSDRNQSDPNLAAVPQWGKVERITSVDGFSLTFSYDGAGNLSRANDSFGRYIAFSFGGDNLLHGITSSDGRTVGYGYNFDGRMVGVTMPNGAGWVYGYDAAGKITSIKDGAGKTFVTNTYNDQGRVVTQLDGNGNTTRFEYIKEKDLFGNETGNQITKITDGRGNVQTQVSNSSGYLVTDSAANNDTTRYEYNGHGQVTKKTMPNGSVYTYDYDGNGNRTVEVWPNGYRKTTAYNASNRPTSVTDQSGTVSYEYNRAQKMTKMIDQLGHATQFFYDSNNFLVKVIDANGAVKEFTNNAAGYVTSEKDTATNSIISYEYDGAGNKTKVTDGQGRVTSFAFSPLNKASKIVDPKGAISKFNYDGNGNLVSQVDETNGTTTYTTDNNENITKTVYANNTQELAKYDGANNKVETTDRNGNVTKYQYDNKNRVVQMDKYGTSNNLLLSEKYRYDANDNRVQYIDAKNNAYNYQYDNVNQQVQQTNPQGGTIQTTYDILGRVTQVKDFENNISKFEYDALGRLTKQIDALNAATTYSYDNLNNVLQKVDALGNVYKQSYDSTGKLVGVTNPKNATSTYTYDNVGHLVTQTNFAGEKTTFTYDANDHIATQKDNLGATTTFTYDARGNLVKVVDPKGNTSQFEYDAVNQKTKEINALNNAQQFNYDANGNLLKFTGENGTSLSYSYDSLNRKSVETDQRGSQTKYEYDLNGNITKITDKRGNATLFTYDSLNRLTQKTLPTSDKTNYAYSANGNLTQFTDETGATRKYNYDKLGRVTSTINELGFTQSYAYDLIGRLTSQTDLKGVSTKFEYDQVGNITKLTDRKGSVTTYVYDAASRVTQVNKPLSVVESMQYDGVGRLQKQVDAMNGATTYSYDSNGNVVTVVDPKGLKTQFQYNAIDQKVATINEIGGKKQITYDQIGRVTENIDELGRKTSYAYDAANNITKITNARGSAVNFEYDAAGNMTKLTDAKGAVTSFNYDVLNRKTQTTLPDNTNEKLAYDKLSRVVSITDPKGNISQKQYDAVGNILAEIDPANFKTSYSYDQNNNILKVTNAANNSTTFVYDANDQVLSSVNPLGKIKTYNYDALGRVTSTIAENGAGTLYNYDKLGRTTKIIDALSGATSLEYDADSNLVKQIDALNHAQAFQYDNLNRVITKTDALSHAENYSYDAVGNLVSVKDKNGNTTNYQYDAVNNKTKVTNALGNATTYVYDANNNMSQVVDANNHTTNYAYDNRNRKVSTTLPGGEKYQYQYDANNNLVKQITPKATNYTYSYDNRNLITQKSDPLGNTISYTYDQIARLTKLTDAQGNNTNYQYDALNRLTQVTDALNAKTSYQYDEVGNLVKEINAANKATSYQYDLLNRKVKETNALNNSWSYTYDAVGNLVKTVDANGTNIVQSYDSMNRLTSTTYGANSPENTTVSYDNVGNITKISRSNIAYTYSFDKANRLTNALDTRGQNVAYTYDPANNRVKITYPDNKTATYTYNVNDQIASLTFVYAGDGVSTKAPQNLTTTFAYDANQNLVKQSNPDRTQITKSYDNADRLINLTNSKIVDDRNTLVDFAKYEYQLNKNGDRTKETIIAKLGDNDSCKKNGDTNCYVDDANGKKEVTFDHDDSDMLAVVKNYQYDAMRRVVDVQNQRSINGDPSKLKTVNEEVYSYDVVGNRTNFTIKDAKGKTQSSINYNYNEINQLTSDNYSNYSYDKNGNRTLIKDKTGKNDAYHKDTNSYTYSYDKANELVNVKASEKSNDKKYTGVDTSYEYDGLGRRVTKVNSTGETCHSRDCDDDEDKAQSTNKGVNKVNYVYDAMSWNQLADYYTRISTKNRPDKKDDKYPGSKYFNVHTDYFYAGSEIVAAENIAERPIAPVGSCHNYEDNGDGRKFDYSKVLDWNKCDDNKLKVNNDKTHTRYITPQSNEIVNYYHFDGLGSVVATSTYNPMYAVNRGVVNPVPVVRTPVISALYDYETFGNRVTLFGDKHEDDNSWKNGKTLPLVPASTGFDNWNNITYSGEPLDTETNNYYYGSRFYDPSIASWNRQDDYRGTTNEPFTRNRYAFVKENPVNYRDVDGYSSYSDPMESYNSSISNYQSSGVMMNAAQSMVGHASDLSNTRFAMVKQIGAMTAALPQLSAQMNAAWWGAYNAKVPYYDNIVMNGVIGRLEARGYDLDYGKVYNYLSGRISETGAMYAYKNQQYNVAKSNYYGTIQGIGALTSTVNVLGNAISNLYRMAGTYQNMAKGFFQAGDAYYKKFEQQNSLSYIFDQGMASFQNGSFFDYVRGNAQYYNKLAMIGAQSLDKQFADYTRFLGNDSLNALNRNVIFQNILDDISNRYPDTSSVTSFLSKLNNVSASFNSAAYEWTTHPITSGMKLGQTFIIRPVEGIAELMALDHDIKNINFYTSEASRFNATGASPTVNKFLEWEFNDKIKNSEIVSGAATAAGTVITAVGAVCTFATAGTCSPSLIVGLGLISVGSGLYDLGSAYQQLQEPISKSWNAPTVKDAIQVGSEYQDGIIFGTLQGTGGAIKFIGGSVMVVKGVQGILANGQAADITIDNKISSQMVKRGWTEASIEETTTKPFTTRTAINKANGNPATVFYKQDGSYVSVDNITRNVIQISDSNNPGSWIPDSTIVDPYKPSP